VIVHGHFQPEVLLDFQEGRVDVDTAARVRAHLDEGCVRCAVEMAFWNRVLGGLQADRAPAPPEEVVQRAFALFNDFERQPTAWRRILAALVFDSRQRTATAGARDLGDTSFKLVFDAENTRIDLLCEQSNGSWQIAGQVLSDDTPEMGWTVRATSKSGQIETDSEMSGEFRIGGFASGNYEFEFRDLNRVIRLPQIRLGSG
jgi:hypothetical protein